MKKLMIMLGLILSLYTYSDGIEMLVGLHTSHNYEFEGYAFNNKNELIAFKYNNIMVGRMVNSCWNESYFIGYDSHISDKFSITTLLSNGYRRDYYIEGEEFYYSDTRVFRNEYKLIPLLNYRLNDNIILSTNGVFNTINYIFEI